MPFTTNSPVAGGIPLPEGVTPVGGIVFDIIGVSGVRVVSQIAASDLYIGYFDQNPGLIGTQAGFTQTAIDALGGGIAEGSVRFTIDDGDTAPFNFDDHENTLLINGIAFGDFSDVPTVVTDGVGNELGAPGTGFPNNQLATGFFHLTDPAALSALYQSLSSGEVTFALSDVDPGDNFFDFTQGIDGEFVDVGQPPNVSPVIDAVSLPGTILEGGRFAVRVDAHDPDATVGGLTYRFDIDGDGVFDVENTTGVARFTIADDLADSLVVEVVDARGGLTRRTVPIVVENVAPVVVLDPIPAISVGGTAKLTGIITDPGVLDSFVLLVDWGDGTTQELPLSRSASGEQAFSLTHVYAAGAEGGAYPVSVTVMDDDGGKGTAETSIEVGDIEAPEITLAPLGVTKEGDAVLLSGVVSGMEGVELYRVEIDWGDGTVERVTVRSEDGGLFSASHVFAGETGSSARDTYPVTATVIAPGIRVADEGMATVRNVAPTLRLDAIEAVLVGGVLTLSGDVIDPGTNDTFTIDVSWGDDTSSSVALGRSPTGRQPFSLDHVFANGPAAGIPIEITVRDDDGAVRTYSRTVDVVEDVPEVTLSKPGAIDEYGIVSIDATIATFADEGPFDLTVVWGDGAVQTLRFNPAAYGSDTITLSHRYLDDRATGADRYGVTVTAVGSAGATGSAATEVSVANVAPTLTLAPIEPIGADGVAMLTGTIFDPGRQDTFTVLIDWGEVGSATRFETIILGPSATGSQNFSRRHVYDDPTAARHNVVATVVDDDGGTARATRVVEAENTAPTLSLSLGNVTTINENGCVTLTVTITDPDAAGPQTVFVDWGDGGTFSEETFEIAVTPDGPRQFSSTYTYRDDRPYAAPDFYEITVTTRDPAGATDTGKVGVQVLNVAPRFTSTLEFTNMKLGDNTIAAGGLVVVSASFEDLGPADTYNIQVNWGDGEVIWSAETPWKFDYASDYAYLGRGGFRTGHFYKHGGIYTMSAVVYDDDGGRGVVTRQVFVEGVGLRSGGVIDVIGEDNPVVVNVFGDSAPQGPLLGGTGVALPGVSPFVTVTTDIPGAFSQSVASSGAKTLNFVGSSRADTIDISPTARVAGILRGEGGSDRLNGGILGDSIEGGVGSDEIFGREGQDSISGGGGNDRIFGDYAAFKVGAFADILYGDEGNDTILGGGGNDTINGGVGIDELAGGAESDVVVGSSGDDLIFGDAYTYVPSSGDPRPQALETIDDGSDWLVGEHGNDRIFGQNGNDTMLGGIGNDTLDGGNGFDVIRTGEGADVIVFREGDDADLVLDFGPGDRIDLRGFDRPYINTVADVLARIGTDGGDTVVYLGYGDNIRLQDVGRAEITADDFLV